MLTCDGMDDRLFSDHDDDDESGFRRWGASRLVR